MRVILGLLVALLVSGCFGSGFTWPDVQPQQCDVSSGSGLRCETVAVGFDSSLVQVAKAGDDLVVVEQEGIVWRMDGARPHERPMLDLRDQVATCHFEQGLLGIAFSPDWPDDPRAFVSYTEDRSCDARGRYGKGDLIVASYTASPDRTRLTPGSHEEVFRVREPYRNHNGGHLLFGPDGLLYVGVGDGGDHGDPLRTGHDPSDLLGSILRIDVLSGPGYVVPHDNPFAPGGEHPGEGAPEVYLYGVRNPWRFTIDGDTMWVADVGQDCFEEVNHLPNGSARGAFLGWSRSEGAHAFDADASGECDAAAPASEGVTPVITYRHGSEGHCSVTGGPVLRGDAALRLGLADGTYLFGDFCSGRLWALVPDEGAPGGHRQEHLLDTGLQITSMGLVDDTVYLLHWAGSLHRLVPMEG